MQRVDPAQPLPLYSSAATRQLERAAAAQLAPHTLMQRAGAAVARLGRALAPHARTIWVACGRGNNGGDGLEAAALLHAHGLPVVASLLPGDPGRLPADAVRSWERARQAGVRFTDVPPPLQAQDLAIDALLGLGLSPEPRGAAPEAALRGWLSQLQDSPAGVLCVDLPSGLLADTGQYAPGLAPGHGSAPGPRHTLALLTLKPGLFTAHGRDAAGQVWLDPLQADAAAHAVAPVAWLSGAPTPASRPHASHKGSFGDVAVVGGEGLSLRGMGMGGAALLAASAALHAGAGRVWLSLLDESEAATAAMLSAQPELMPRRFEALALDELTVVAGCGGGVAIAPLMAQLLDRAPRLLLDADALNAIAADPALAALLLRRNRQGGAATVLTPHPLEAARLLKTSSAAVQADRLGAAAELAARSGCTVVLKGSGSIIAAPDGVPRLNPTGNARLASPGTGDILAGLIGARLAAARAAPPQAALEAATAACWQHGAAADGWPVGQALTALALARRLAPG